MMLKKNNKIIIVSICIILIISIIGVFIIPNIIKHNKAKEHYYEYESYYATNPEDITIREDKYKIITNKDEYLDYLSNYDIELDEDDLEDIEDKNYINYNYVLVFIPTNGCGEKIYYDDIKINEKKQKIVLEFSAKEACGVCAFDYLLYEITIPKSIEESYNIEINWEVEDTNCDPYIAFKPILYLYPEQTTNIKVNFANEKNLTTTYPKFKNEWNIIANPNGDLYDKEGNYYYALYWEEKDYSKVDFTEGFYVDKENAINFLEEKLNILGLNNKERNEFIMYWLPILEKNEHNLVYFELTEDLQKENELIITPKPNTLIRIRMHVKKVNNKVAIKEQQLVKQDRIGYTAIEWGGVIHK